MKLNKWLYGATALAMLAACSDKDIAPDSGGGEPAETSKGYIGIRIQLPSEPSTRADGSFNDQFDDGVSQEYKLETATLVLFRCDAGTESANDIDTNAKSIGAYALEKSKNQANLDDSKQITTELIRYAAVTGMQQDESLNLYALVIANGDEYDLTPAYINDNLLGRTIKQFQETTTNKMLYTQSTPGSGYASKIFMSNSPLSIYRGGKYDPNGDGNPDTENTSSLTTIPVLPVLVEINKTVYPTEEAAVSNPAGIIHIERAVGKVTCSSFNTETSVIVQVEDKYYKLVASNIKWDLGQDMMNTYLVRNTNRKPVDPTLAPNLYGDDKSNMWAWNYQSTIIDESKVYAADDGPFRMIGHTQIQSRDVNNNPVTYYRPYFCQVPGYGEDKYTTKIYENKTFRGVETVIDGESKVLNYSSETKSYYLDPDNAVAWNAKSAFYPHENTFPVDYMRYANTTRIGFWVDFKFASCDKDGNVGTTPTYNDKLAQKDFYTVGLDRSVLYLDNPLIPMAIEKLKQNENIKTAVKNAMNTAAAGGYDNLDLGNLITIKADKITDDGQIEITEVNFKELVDFPENVRSKFNSKPEYEFQDDIASLNDLEKVYIYKGGKAFYEVRIMHFGQDLTPWNKNDHDKASTIEDSYGSAASRNDNYLGRYGIVRNNWYDLNVQSISKLGPPVDPAKWDESWPGKPDDNKDEYIAVILRVLSWAKRTQNVEF